MLELTNEQRKCLGLEPVDAAWEKVTVKPGPNDDYATYAYLDGQRVRKVILSSREESPKAKYCEYGSDARLSPDGRMLLPKTDRGKAKPFTACNLLKTVGKGMALQFSGGSLYLVNLTSQQCFYRADYEGLSLDGISAFAEWVGDWCRLTGEKELAEIRRQLRIDEDDTRRSPVETVSMSK